MSILSFVLLVSIFDQSNCLISVKVLEWIYHAELYAKSMRKQYFHQNINDVLCFTIQFAFFLCYSIYYFQHIRSFFFVPGILDTSPFATIFCALIIYLDFDAELFCWWPLCSLHGQSIVMIATNVFFSLIITVFGLEIALARVIIVSFGE
jgi:hypothetical protein